MRRHAHIRSACAVAGALAVTALSVAPAFAADVTSLPAQVSVNATEDIAVILETPYIDPETGDYASTCSDTWTTRVLGVSRVIKPIAPAECDGISTWWQIQTRKGLKPKSTAIIEFTRTGADGQVISVQRLVVKVIVPKPGSGGVHGGGPASGMCDPKVDRFCTAVAGSM